MTSNLYNKSLSAKPKGDGDFYSKQASPRMIGDLAEKLERQRQMTGGESTWNTMKATAKTPQEKNEIREIIREDYKRNGPKGMSQDDLKWIGKSKYQNSVNNIKIDVSGISDSVNNYINATQIPEPVAPPKKPKDPDLNLGVASLLGETYDS